MPLAPVVQRAQRITISSRQIAIQRIKCTPNNIFYPLFEPTGELSGATLGSGDYFLNLKLREPHCSCFNKIIIDPDSFISR